MRLHRCNLQPAEHGLQQLFRAVDFAVGHNRVKWIFVDKKQEEVTERSLKPRVRLFRENYSGGHPRPVRQLTDRLLLKQARDEPPSSVTCC